MFGYANVSIWIHSFRCPTAADRFLARRATVSSEVAEPANVTILGIRGLAGRGRARTSAVRLGLSV